MDENKKAYSTEKIIDEIFKKKTDFYGAGEKARNNFAIPHELTVTITLSEYRNLVGEVAKKEADISKINEELYERGQRVKELEEKVKNLMEKLYNQNGEEETV